MKDLHSYRKPPSGIDKSLITWDRLWILDEIVVNGGEASFQSLSSHLDIKPGSLNNHLAKLEGADLIRIEKSFLNNRPLTKVVMTETGWRVYNEVKAKIQEWIEYDDVRRATPPAGGV